ncbi:MAG TPA: transcriptional regulator MraZ [Rhizobiales bacterium]|nr:transcriptional regulator MraZ [Hyphomicrobiales bacterium]
MEQFVSSYTNRVDAKGRVSVPASFRAILTRDGFDGIFCYPSLDSKALDVGGASLIDEIHGLLEGLDPYSDERDELSLALFGESEILKIDQDGRVVLPLALREHAEISDRAVFVGVGHKFQIWSPPRFEERRTSARRRVVELKKLLRKASGGQAEALGSAGK